MYVVIAAILHGCFVTHALPRHYISSTDTVSFQRKRALTLLNADEGLTDMEIAVALKIGLLTVGRVPTRYVKDGLKSALSERPVVCFDETSKRMVAHTRNPIEAGHERPKRIDYEYKRNGARNQFGKESSGKGETLPLLLSSLWIRCYGTLATTIDESRIRMSPGTWGLHAAGHLSSYSPWG